jgi:hypothetical protein
LDQVLGVGLAAQKHAGRGKKHGPKASKLGVHQSTISAHYPVRHTRPRPVPWTGDSSH